MLIIVTIFAINFTFQFFTKDTAVAAVNESPIYLSNSPEGIYEILVAKSAMAQKKDRSSLSRVPHNER
ncbi:hypothetical protein Glo7428_2829 [Gloeocapsa sp. PCC 7428]|uniref:hypothetical protein n=1 Tax=Gloeocapsa sp. PCC 7428 TaxID=1173026 RepID=UPI0002A5BCEA|nr:hypothetical protein [Gloeocapsa sp. PCC 7428]AFZ31330.1 hypothetical protein Glo7428_2829 [Gloeocapsa sp. PCC 7428]